MLLAVDTKCHTQAPHLSVYTALSAYMAVPFCLIQHILEVSIISIITPFTKIAIEATKLAWQWFTFIIFSEVITSSSVLLLPTFSN